MDDLTRLLIAAGAGDEPALSGFVRATQADVWRFCAHLVDRSSADDLTQEVYVQALRSLGTFRADASARTWLLAVARNVCADEIRRRQRVRDRFVPGAGGAAVVADAAGAVELADVIGRLDEDRRVAFVLTQVLGWSYADAAEACEVPVGTIRSRVSRARAELMAWLHAPGAARLS